MTHALAGRPAPRESLTNIPALLAAREELIERILKSAEAHALDHAQLVAVSVHATAAAYAEAARVNPRKVGEALQTSIHRYLSELGADR